MEVTMSKGCMELADTAEYKEERYVEGILRVETVTKNKLKVIHTNSSDPDYFYEYEVTGTKEELGIIEQFCKKLTELDRGEHKVDFQKRIKEAY